MLQEENFNYDFFFFFSKKSLIDSSWKLSFPNQQKKHNKDFVIFTKTVESTIWWCLLVALVIYIFIYYLSTTNTIRT